MQLGMYLALFHFIVAFVFLVVLFCFVASTTNNKEKKVYDYVYDYFCLF